MIRATTFGAYEILARLGRGPITQTFLARQSGVDSFHRLLSLKMLLLPPSEQLIQTFLGDTRAAAHLNHANCASIYDLGKEHGAYFIAGEWVTGENLETVIDAAMSQSVDISDATIASIMVLLADAVEHAHRLIDPHGRPCNLIHGALS